MEVLLKLLEMVFANPAKSAVFGAAGSIALPIVPESIVF
jgi:hypothetical protein